MRYSYAAHINDPEALGRWVMRMEQSGRGWDFERFERDGWFGATCGALGGKFETRGEALARCLKKIAAQTRRRARAGLS